MQSFRYQLSWSKLCRLRNGFLGAHDSVECVKAGLVDVKLTRLPVQPVKPTNHFLQYAEPSELGHRR